MSSIKSFFDKYLPFPGHRKRKLSEEEQQHHHLEPPKRKLARLQQHHHLQFPPFSSCGRARPELGKRQAQNSRFFPSGPAPKNKIPLLIPKRKTFGMETIDLESDDDVELVEYLQSRDLSPETIRKLSGRQNVLKPLPALIPRNYLKNGAAPQMHHHQQSSRSGDFVFPTPYFGSSGASSSRAQTMVNTALRRAFEQEERQKYSDIYRSLGPMTSQPRSILTAKPANGSLFGALAGSSQSSSVLSRLPLASQASVNLGSRNKYSKLLEKFSSEIDTRQPTTIRKQMNLKPSACVDLTITNGQDGHCDRQRRRIAHQELNGSVVLTDDDEEEAEEEVMVASSSDENQCGGQSNHFKIPKSFPCAAPEEQQRQQRQPRPSFDWEWIVSAGNRKAATTTTTASSSPVLLLDDASAVIALDDDSSSRSSQRSGSQQQRRAEKVEPVNSLLEEWQTKPEFKDDWLEATRRRYSQSQQQLSQRIAAEEENAEVMARESKREVQDMIRKMDEALLLREVIVVEDEEKAERDAEAAKEAADTPLPDFTPDQINHIRYAAGKGSPDEVLISKFNLDIRRRDIATLIGDAWLNDEVINFYMNLLMERSTTNPKYPKVYAMNTFFLPKVLQQGQSGVRRWTRKVDIFAYDIIPVPVHVSNIHWCMAIVHLRDKTIRYYDSMGQPNKRALDALEQYLKDESQDKRGQPLCTDGWVKESVANCPRQMNGSDCGVFSCMFAEYVTRNHRISFSQDNMPYFRQKMILEICTGKLLL